MPCEFHFSLTHIEIHINRVTDVRFSVVRNSLESPLLSLPAEIRNMIFQYALGGQHIHISAHIRYRKDGELIASNDWAFGTVTHRAFHNQAYPKHHWHKSHHFKKGKVEVLQGVSRECIPFLQRGIVSKKAWEIELPGSHMTAVSAVCRQIYNETKSLPYALNDFSFENQYVFRDWIKNRTASQKRELQALWYELMEVSYYPLSWYIDYDILASCSGLKLIRVFASEDWRRLHNSYENNMAKKKLKEYLIERLKKDETTLQIDFGKI